MKFEVIDKTKLAYQVAQQIIKLINQGEFRHGDRLPSERELAEMMGVSRGSIREALSTLQAAGIVVTKTGAGTFVNEDMLSQKNEMRALANVFQSENPIDILEVREAIESKGAFLAAENRTNEDIENIKNALLKQKELATKGQEPTEADKMFHMAIAVASHNAVLIEMVEYIQSLMEKTFWVMLMNNLGQLMAHDQNFSEYYLTEHEGILNAIIEQDSEKAHSLMIKHLHNVSNNLYKISL